jgi:hypothetical protein
MYIPGRFRTGSNPSRTVIDSALYPDDSFGFFFGSFEDFGMGDKKKVPCGSSYFTTPSEEHLM